MNRYSKITISIHVFHECKTWKTSVIYCFRYLLAAGIAAIGLASVGAAYALYQWLKDGPFTPLVNSLMDEEGVSQLWGQNNPLLQIIPNLGWLRGGDYSAWF